MTITRLDIIIRYAQEMTDCVEHCRKGGHEFYRDYADDILVSLVGTLSAVGGDPVNTHERNIIRGILEGYRQVSGRPPLTCAID